MLILSDRDMIVNFKPGEYMRNIIPYTFSLEGTASYQTDGGIKSLHLDGRSGYAEIPAINFTKSSFSIALRFYVHNSHCLGHLISDWSSPGQFRLYVNHRKVFVELRRSGVVQTLLNMTSDRLVKTRSHDFSFPLVLEYQARKGIMIDDKTASTLLSAHKKLLDIYCHDFASNRWSLDSKWVELFAF